MTTTTNNVRNAKGKQNQEIDFVRLQDVLALCKVQWYWFLISVILCLGAGVAWVLKTTPIYTREASILIKEEGTGRTNSFSADIASYADMGLFNNTANIDNEVVLIQSPSVVLEVIKRLKIENEYTSDGMFHRNVLYGKDLPYIVTFEDLTDDDGCTFDLKIKDANSISLCKVAFGPEDIDENKEFAGTVGQPIITPMGKVVINNNPSFEGDVTPGIIHVKRGKAIDCIESCKGRLKAGQSSKNTNIIDLSYTDASIKRAEDFLNTLIAVHNENWLKDKNLIAISTAQFITERLDNIAAELEQVESNISTYKSSHLIPNLEETTRNYIQQADAVSTKVMELNTQLALAQFIRQALSNPGEKQLLPANSGINSGMIERQIGDYNAKLLQRNSLAENSSSKNPMVVDYDKQLSLMNRAIISSVDNEINSIQCQLDAFKTSEKENNTKMASNPKQAKHLLSVERQQKVKESLYLFLLQKREEAQLSQAFTAYNTRIVNPPMGKNVPTAPLKKNIILIAFALGLAIPFAVIYLNEALSTKLRGRKDVESLTIPFIGEIPQIESGKKSFFKKKNKDDNAGILVKPGSRNIINEAFRVVRTNLEFVLGEENKAKIIMTTSANPGSGKTFITSNIGMSLAIKDKKVLMIDLDLRRASLSKIIDSPKAGMSEYLSRKASNWNEVLIKGKLHPCLDMIPVGTIPPNPTELLFSERLETLITEAKTIYDYILIDCPPIEVVADTMIINKWVDTTIFVVRTGLYERERLVNLQEYYDDKKFNNMVLMLNGSQMNSSRQGYGYGYSYGYGYGHNYGAYYNEKE